MTVHPLDPRDRALQASCPCLPVPRFGPLEPLQRGQRTLVAHDGLYAELRLPWLHLITRLAELPPQPPLPYGAVQETLSLSFGRIPRALLHEFIAVGRAALPNEIAGGLIHDARHNTLRLVMFEAEASSPGSVRYRMPVLAQHESLVLDLHTHGCGRAFWSVDDDADDQGIKLCGVFGELHREEPSARFRLAFNGRFTELDRPWRQGRPALERASREPTLDSMEPSEHSLWNT